MKKNIIAILTVIALIVCMIPSVFAAESADPALTVTPGASSVAPGGSITVTVALTNNPGHVCGEIELTVSDPALTLVAIEADEDFFTFDTDNTDGMSNKIVYTSITPYTEATVTLFTATFAVDPNAQDGSYMVTATGTNFYKAYEEGSAAGTTFAVANGVAAIAVETPATPTLTVTPYAGSVEIHYNVEGQVVTVTYDKPCKVGYWDGTKYVALTATAGSAENTYTFTAPEGVTNVILVVKGDVDGNGDAAVADKLTIARSLLPTAHAAHADLTAVQIFAADFDGNGDVAVADKLTMARSLLPTSHAAYAALTW